MAFGRDIKREEANNYEQLTIPRTVMFKFQKSGK
jgi:hypothetical protein